MPCNIFLTVMLNVKMADVAARREARRRRILENSHNRLQLISGKCGDDFPRDSPTRTIIPEQNHEVSLSSDSITCTKDLPNNCASVKEPESFDLLSLSHDIAAGDGEVPNELASFMSPVQEPIQTIPVLDKLTTYRYDIVLLSLIIQLLYSMSLVTFNDTYFFLPLLIYVITKLIWFPPQSNSKFASVLLLLNGMSSPRVQYVIHIIQCLTVISRDVCVFLFTTICIQSLLITLKNCLVT